MLLSFSLSPSPFTLLPFLSIPKPIPTNRPFKKIKSKWAPPSGAIFSSICQSLELLSKFSGDCIMTHTLVPFSQGAEAVWHSQGVGDLGMSASGWRHCAPANSMSPGLPVCLLQGSPSELCLNGSPSGWLPVSCLLSKEVKPRHFTKAGTTARWV